MELEAQERWNRRLRIQVALLAILLAWASLAYARWSVAANVELAGQEWPTRGLPWAFVVGLMVSTGLTTGGLISTLLDGRTSRSWTIAVMLAAATFVSALWGYMTCIAGTTCSPAALAGPGPLEWLLMGGFSLAVGAAVFRDFVTPRETTPTAAE